MSAPAFRLKKNVKTLLDEAAAKTKGISPEAAQQKMGDANTLFVDIRDVRELERDGMIPGAFHAPRGMLEFWVDPESKYYKPVFVPGKTYILYCAADWRATLAAGVLAEMGMDNVLHLEGGFDEWKKAGHPVGARPHKPKT
ncbi:MAG: rhodanese-like domain-containing protein [Betaproteobacteria bacterium]|jgi:rhodanese-related sulfurtransferase|nr:rhodanese-like domain-containing protein [Betaproteobacteria bacterium]